MKRMLKSRETSNLRFKTEWMKTERLMRKIKKKEEKLEEKRWTHKKKKPKKVTQCLGQNKQYSEDPMTNKWKKTNDL